MSKTLRKYISEVYKKKKSIAKTDWAVGLLFYKYVLSKRMSNLKYLWVLFSKLQTDLSK